MTPGPLPCNDPDCPRCYPQEPEERDPYEEAERLEWQREVDMEAEWEREERR